MNRFGTHVRFFQQAEENAGGGKSKDKDAAAKAAAASAEESDRAAAEAKAKRLAAEKAVLEANEAERTAQDRARAAAAGATAGAAAKALADLKESPMVLANSTREVNVTLAHGVMVKIEKGVTQVPEIVARHWHAKAMGVVVVDLDAVATQLAEQAKAAQAAADKARAEADNARRMSGKKK